MTWSDFQNVVLALANRSVNDVTVTGLTPNLVVVCANMAKAEAQKRHNFKMARCQAFMNGSIDGVDLSTAQTLPTGGVAVPLKLIEQVWTYGQVGSVYRKVKRLPFMTLGDLKVEYPSAVINDLTQINTLTQPFPSYQDVRWFIQGTTFNVLGTANGAIPVLVDAIKWMPDYDGTITDFFLTYHFDWMIMKTLDFMNIFMKEDQRISISQTKAETAWRAVCNFDDTYAESTFEAGAIE